jgi:hypothetical protein
VTRNGQCLTATEMMTARVRTVAATAVNTPLSVASVADEKQTKHAGRCRKTDGQQDDADLFGSAGRNENSRNSQQTVQTKNCCIHVAWLHALRAEAPHIDPSSATGTTGATLGAGARWPSSLRAR